MTQRFDPRYTWLGIPPEHQPPNHYRLLGIEVFESNLDVIESAADQRMTHLRSFQTGKHGHLAQKLLNEVAVAKICLLDAKRKPRYDATLRVRLAAQQAEAVEADMFSPSGQTARAAFSVSTTRKAKPKPNVAMISALAAASVAVVLIGAWVPRSGGNTPNEPPSVAIATPVEQPPEATPPLRDSPANKTEERGPPNGDDRPAPPRAATPKPPERAKQRSAPQTPPSGEAGPKPREEAKNRLIPSAEIQRKVGRNIEAVFKVAEAKTPEAKIKLAKELAEVADKTTNPDEQYVLLRKAVDLACDGGDATLMLGMLGPMTDAFAIEEPLSEKAAMLERFAKGPRNPARLKSLVEGSAGVIDDAMGEDRYDIASDVAEWVLNACASSTSPLSKQLRIDAAARRRRVQQLQKQFQEFGKASDGLKSNPDDAKANLAVGAWHCLIKNDWQTGLPHLAKGSDAGLKALAGRDLSSPRASPEEEVKLADAWWDAAADRRGDENAALLRRSGHWYEQSLPNLEGVNKKKAEQRLAEIAKLGEELAPPAGRQPPPGRQPPLAIAPFPAKQARSYQVQWARYLKVPVEFTNSVGMKFVLIPPGEFDMGSTEQEVKRLLSQAKDRNLPQRDIDRLPAETPRHRVRITRAFYLGSFEVTQAQYAQVMGKNPTGYKETGPDAPVEQVTWDEAVTYCQRLSALPAGKSAGGVYHLPTEAEWEYAARAGTTTAWCFGDEEAGLSDYAWWGGNCGSKTHPVGGKRSNGFGLFDVHGNVMEWCADWHAPYSQSPETDPAGPSAGVSRVLRGGAWDVDPFYFRCAFRLNYGPGTRSVYIGFRVARTLTP